MKVKRTESLGLLLLQAEASLMTKKDFSLVAVTAETHPPGYSFHTDSEGE